MGEVIGRDKMEDRLCGHVGVSPQGGVAALEVDGVVDGEVIISWARANPRSAIFAMLECNDAKAAHAYRLAQIGELLTGSAAHLYEELTS